MAHASGYMCSPIVGLYPRRFGEARQEFPLRGRTTVRTGGTASIGRSESTPPRCRPGELVATRTRPGAESEAPAYLLPGASLGFRRLRPFRRAEHSVGFG
jgi:hypothetical protein